MYKVQLITLDQLRQHRSMPTDITTDDALLTRFIKDASAAIISELGGRIPHPYAATRVMDWHNATRLGLDEDLCEITSITNGDGTTLASDNYILSPRNEYPKWEVQIKDNASAYFNYSTNRMGAISVAGIWGYVPHYATCWRVSTTLNGAISATDTDIHMDDIDGIGVGSYIKIDSEQLYVVSKSGLSGHITVRRGENGTTAAIHADAVTAYLYEGLDDIQSVVCDYAAYLYKSKDSMAGQVNIYEHGSVRSADVGDRVKQTIEMHKRRTIKAVGNGYYY